MIQIVSEEIGVFEDDQESQIRGDRNAQNDFAAALTSEPVDEQSIDVIRQDRGEHHKDESFFTPCVKKEAAQQQYMVPEPVRREEIESQNDRQEQKQKNR